jgi:hypothetical protein
MTYQSRVHETYSRLPNLKTLVIDAREDGGEHGARSAGAADYGRRAFVEDDDVVADGRDVGVAAAGAVVCCCCCQSVCGSRRCMEVGIRTNAITIGWARVRLVRRWRGLEVSRDSGGLV